MGVERQVEAVATGAGDRGGVGEQHAPLVGHALDLLGQPARRLEAAGVEAVAGGVREGRHAVVEQDRAEQEQGRRAPATVGPVHRHVVDVAVQGVGDGRRRALEAGLEVVAAEHHHHEVQRVVRHQRGRERRPAVAVRPVDVVDVGGAAVQPLLDDVVAVAEQPLEPTRPPDVGPEPHVLGVVTRGAVGVGVAEAQHAYGVRFGQHVSAAGRRSARRRGRGGAWCASGGQGRPRCCGASACPRRGRSPGRRSPRPARRPPRGSRRP